MKKYFVLALISCSFAVQLGSNENWSDWTAGILLGLAAIIHFDIGGKRRGEG